MRHDLIVQILFLFGPITAAFLNDPETGDVFEESHRIAVADFVREVQFPARVVNDRFGQFDAHQRPGAGTQEGPILTGGGQACYGGGSVVRAGGNDLYVLQIGLLGNVGTQRAQHGARRDNLRKQFGRQPQGLNQFVRPVFCDGVVKLRRAGHRDFEFGNTREEIIKPVRHRQQLVGFADPLGLFRAQLEQGVDRHFLDARLGVNGFPRNFGQYFLHAGAGTRVAIMVGWRDQRAVCPEEHVVHPPGIATDTGDGVLALGDFAQADQDLLEELRDVPVERVLVLDGLVVETVKIAQQELSVVESSQDHAAAFRAQVASNVVGRHN